MLRQLFPWLAPTLVAGVLVIGFVFREVASEAELGADQQSPLETAIVSLGLVRHLERERDRAATSPVPGTVAFPTGPAELEIVRKAEGLRTADLVSRLLASSRVDFNQVDRNVLREFLASSAGRKLVAVVAARDRAWDAEQRQVLSAARRLLLRRRFGPTLRRVLDRD